MADRAANLPLVNGGDTGRARLLLVDDDVAVRMGLELLLKWHGFDVVIAASVNEALKLIGERTFDVLLSDLHMPQPGDGLTVVSAMRHANPKAVTLILSAYPEMKNATAALLRQADEILLKPMTADSLAKVIRERLATGAGPEPPAIESVASILERETQSTIRQWLDRVDADPLVNIVPLDEHERSAHLPQLFRDLILRLRNPPPLGERSPVSQPAVEHGQRRREQGYTAAMLVEESRMLQVSIFQTLQNNLSRVDFSKVLMAVMSIADEVDSQLSQQMTSYVAESKVDRLAVVA